MLRRMIVLAALTGAACAPVSNGTGASADRAQAMLESGDYAGAERVFASLIEQGPDDPALSDWLTGRGIALLRLGRIDEARLAASNASAAARDDRQAAGAGLLMAMAESAGGGHLRSVTDLAGLDIESLSGSEAAMAESLASAELTSLSIAELQRSRATGWLEPWVLLELSSRYIASGDADRASLTLSELDRLYPGFRERHGGLQAQQTGAGAYIALLLPLTGEGSAYAGQVRNGVELAFSREADQVSGLPSLSVLDTKGDSGELTRLASMLGDDANCLAVIGPMTSRETMSIAGLAAGKKLVFLSPTATSADVDKLGDYVHRLAASSSDEAAAVAEYAVNTAGCRRLAILHSYTSASVAQAEQFTATVEDLGGEIVATKAFNTDDTDFRSQIMGIRGAGADGVFLPVTAYEAIQIAPQLKFYSVDAPMFGTSGWDNEVVPRMAGESVEGAVFTCSFGSSSVYPPTARFVFYYKRAYSEDPSLLAAQGYDASCILIKAWSDGCRTRQSIESYLNRMGVYSGAAGMSTIGSRTEVRVALPIVTIVEGEIVGID